MASIVRINFQLRPPTNIMTQNRIMIIILVERSG